MAQARAFSIADDSHTGSLISEFHPANVNLYRRSLSIPSFRSVEIDYNVEFLFASEKTESIQLPQTFPEIPSPEIEPIPLFEHVPRSPTPKTDGGLRTHLQRFIAKQDNVAATRMLARERRRELRCKRNGVIDLEAGFMNKLNQLLIDHRDNPARLDPALLTLFEQYQDARNEYSSFEDDYNQLEDQLDREEFELEEVIKALRKAGDREGDKGLFSGSEKSAKNNAPNFAEIYHPLVIQYYSRIGDMNLLKEELWNLRAEYDMAQEDQATKHKYGMAVQDSNLLELLQNFAKYEEEILDDLTAVDNDVQQLKAQCDALGLLDDPQESTLLDPLEVMEDIPNLQWTRRRPSFFEENPGLQTSAEAKISMTEFIDKWLLHQLFESPLDRLRSSPEPIEFPVYEPHQANDSWAKLSVNLGTPDSYIFKSAAPIDNDIILDMLSPNGPNSDPCTPKDEPVLPTAMRICDFDCPMGSLVDKSLNNNSPSAMLAVEEEANAINIASGNPDNSAISSF
ncbi:hypothetical protein CIHG_09903 [Coccidioides immitis H538.4]|uniref:Uncharacterized protein n=1 Tax=Coccidioides immitis H538.4 TaxID=396776 RepID=A0A0J8S3M9_COCIT|nr:hypothetical protein CIHG_09903 [Coccidioides immitis H538.4]